MTQPWYANETALYRILRRNGLEGLNNIMKARYEAHYDRGESLIPLIFNGRWVSDSCGNICKILPDHLIPAEVLNPCPQVMTMSMFELLCMAAGIEPRISYSLSGFSLPPADVVCAYCHTPWTLENAHDSLSIDGYEEVNLEAFAGQCLAKAQEQLTTKEKLYYLQPERSLYNPRYVDLSPREDNPELAVNEHGYIKVDKHQHIIEPGDKAAFGTWCFYHPACNRQRRAKSEIQYFMDIFQEAGFLLESLQFTQILNQYWDSDYSAPWFVVTTPWATFTVGWRKRVIHLDWPAERPYSDFFTKEETTKWETGIHAHGRNKLVEYLKRILSFENMVVFA